MASTHRKPSISVKILATFLALLLFTQSLAPAYSFNAVYKNPRYINLAPAPFSERNTAEYKVGTSLIIMIEKNPIVPIEVLTLEGIDAILRGNQRFLTENGVTFLPDYHEIKISFGKGIILRYADASVRLRGVQGFVITSQEKTGPFIRQVLRKEEAPAPVKQEQLQFDFNPPNIKVPEEGENGPSVPAAVTTPEGPVRRTRPVARQLREIEALDSRIYKDTKSFLVMLEKRMWRSYKIEGLISILRKDIAKYGYVRIRAFGWFSGDVSSLLTRWRMSDNRKDLIKLRMARISENIVRRDKLSRGIDIYAGAKEYARPDARRNIIFMLAGIESELNIVVEEMDGQSALRQRYGEIANDLRSIQKWLNGQGEEPIRDMGRCEAALRATAKHLPEARRDKVLSIADKMAALKLPMDRAWRDNPPAGSIAGVFEYLCSQNITTPEMSLSADDIARGLDRSYETIKYDLRRLYYHLSLLKKTDTQETGRDARFYVPESVKKKAGNIYPILARFVGKKLRPAKQDLIYAHKVIHNLIGIRDSFTGEFNTELAQVRVLLRMQIPDKDTYERVSAYGAEVRDFIIRHQAILGVKGAYVKDVLNELGFNIMEHGNGGEITVSVENLVNERLWLKIIGKDNESGPSISRNEFVTAGRDSMSRFLYANVSDDTGIVVSGQRFSKIALDPNSVTIEYQGKRFVGLANDNDAGAWFYEENVAGATTKGKNFELKFDLGRDVASMGPETEKFDKIHDLSQVGARAQIGDNAKILLSENLFIRDGDETELTQVRIALAPVLKSGHIAIMKPDDMRKAAMNRNVSKDKLAIVLTRKDFSNKEIWNGSDKETSLKSSVLILDQRLTGSNYLYLEGVIGLARAVMANNRQAIRAYYELISGSAIDDEIMTLLDDTTQNNVSFAIKAILRFKLITRINPEDLNERRIRMENLLIAA